MKAIDGVTTIVTVTASSTNASAASDNNVACHRVNSSVVATCSPDTRDFGKVRLGANRPAI